MDDEDYDDEPFEGARTMSLSITLGVLMMEWPLHELMVFRLFEKLCKAPPEQARALWFSIISLDMRLRIMTQLATLVADEECKREALSLIVTTRRLSETRNKFTHWSWTTSDGRDWAVQDPRKVGRNVLAVSADSVRALSTEIHRANDSLIQLALRMDGLQIAREPE